MDAILRSKQSIELEIVLEIEYSTTIGHAIRPHFELLFDVLVQQLTELWQFQNLTYFFLPRGLVI